MKQQVLQCDCVCVCLASSSSMQSASFLGRIILSCVVCLAVPHYLTYGTIFGGKKCILNKICVLIFSAIFDTFLILRRIKYDSIINVENS
jgi:putative effector of murein hydrolase